MLPAAPGGPAGLGLDVEPLERWRRIATDAVAWERTGRAFTRDERAEIDASPDPAAAAASRWVAKEAVVKCLHGTIGLRDVEVLRASHGGLQVRRPERSRAAVLVSVSHTATHVFGAAWTGDPRGGADASTSP